VSQCGLCHKQFESAIFFKAKKELWKLTYLTMQKYNLQKKNPLKETKNPSRYYNSRTNLKFPHKPKYIIF
jgi:hypothetical protein